MHLPPISISIPTIFLIWCVAGVLVHGWVMLAYPAMWASVGVFFLAFNWWLRSRSSGGASQPPTTA